MYMRRVGISLYHKNRRRKYRSSRGNNEYLGQNRRLAMHADSIGSKGKQRRCRSLRISWLEFTGDWGKEWTHQVSCTTFSDAGTRLEEAGLCDDWERKRS